MQKKIEPGNLIQHTVIDHSDKYAKEKVENILNAKNDTPEHQRILILSQESKHARSYTRSEYENMIYWSNAEVKPMYTDKYFVRYQTKEGIAYNKKTKTFRVWFGKSFKEITPSLRDDIFKFLGPKAEFLSAVPRFFRDRISVSLLNKIAKGKVTNPKDYIKYYLKEKFPKMQLSTELVWRISKNENAKTYTFVLELFESFNYTFKTCSNPDALLNHILANPNIYTVNHLDSLRDTSEQVFIMGRKVSYCWSTKRLEEEHSKLSREVAMLKFSKEPLVEYGYSNPVPHPFIKLLTNSKELFIEGNGMNHCVYSNYSSRVASKTYFVFHYDDGETYATIGVSKSSNRLLEYGRYVSEWTLSQMKTRKNGLVSKEIQNQVKEYLKTTEMQEFFKTNSKVNKNVEESVSFI